MKDKLALIEYLSPRKVAHLDVLGRGRREDELFKILKKEGSLDNETLKERMALQGSNWNSDLSKLKNAMFDTLVNTCLAIHPNKEAPRRTLTYRSLKRAQCLMELLKVESRMDLSAGIARDRIKRAIDYEFFDIVSTFAATLRYYHSVISFDKGLHDKYKKIYLSAQMKWELELKMDQLYCEFCVEFNISNFERVARIAKEAEMLLRHGNSYKSVLVGYNLITYYHLSVGQYDQAIALCRKALKYFEAKSVGSQRPLFTFNYKLIPVYIITGNHAEAIKSIKRCCEIQQEGSFNYFLARRYLIVLAFHQEEFDLALRVTESEDVELMSGKLKESWKLLSAYAYLLCGRQSDVRLGKLLNEFSVIDSDKTAYNINITILDLLCRLKRADFNSIVDKLGGVERYVLRYLNEDKNIRPRIFLSAIIDLVKNNFKHLDLSAYQRKLAAHPMDKTGQDIDLEIVPFELLLNMLTV